MREEAARLVASLRRAADEAAEDPEFETLVDRLSAFPEFRWLWARHEMKRRAATHKELRHPTLGTLVFTTEAFAADDLRVVAFLPDPPTARVLRRIGRRQR